MMPGSYPVIPIPRTPGQVYDDLDTTGERIHFVLKWSLICLIVGALLGLMVLAFSGCLTALVWAGAAFVTGGIWLLWAINWVFESDIDWPEVHWVTCIFATTLTIGLVGSGVTAMYAGFL